MSADRRSRHQREEISIGEHDHPRSQGRQNPAFQLIVKVGAYISASVSRVTTFSASSTSMSFATSDDRRRPIVCTANPSDSSHSVSNAIWVDRPEPSVPSRTIKVPLNSWSFTPGSGIP